MLVASVSEAKNKLSALLDRVRAGESVLIVDRGIPVASLRPAVSPDEEPSGRLARLQRAGILRAGDGRPVQRVIRQEPPRAGGSATAALIEERREGR
ncbi:MAG TPA: type II toxin-antitoxin system prevent-host-death family antitoxin [Actinomycetota bacterium]